MDRLYEGGVLMCIVLIDCIKMAGSSLNQASKCPSAMELRVPESDGICSRGRVWHDRVLSSTIIILIDHLRLHVFYGY